MPDTEKLKDKVAIITGAAQGLGKEIAIEFARQGAHIVLIDINQKEAQRVENLLHKKKFYVDLITIDACDSKDVNKAINVIAKKYKKIDILVNAVGGFDKLDSIEDINDQEWNKVINLNLNAVFYCCKAVVPFMAKNDYGRIVNIASIAGKEGNPNASAYSTSKAGVIGLTKSLGKELAQKNIAVNCVTPAAAKTRIFDQMTEEHINYMLSKIPRNKFAKVEELASLVTWLASEENSFSTAAVFDLSGGRATY